MTDNGQVTLGDSVRLRLPDGTSRYGIVERLRPGSSPAGVCVAFPATDMAAAATHVECDLGLLQPVADMELRAFLAANIYRGMPSAQQAASTAPRRAARS